jgi:hypothetical protein
VAKKPEGVSREKWLEERNRVWARRNTLLNALIVAVCAAVLWRYCAS